MNAPVTTTMHCALSSNDVITHVVYFDVRTLNVFLNVAKSCEKENFLCEPSQSCACANDVLFSLVQTNG